MNQKFFNYLQSQNLHFDIQTFSASTRTSADAATALGCQLGQIAKSLIFQTADGKPLLIIASGPNRVDETKIEALIGQKITKADADFVQQQTGYAIGGVPPVGFPAPIDTYIDEDLLAFPQIWSAAGDPHSVFALTPTDLVRITGGIIACVKKSPN